MKFKENITQKEFTTKRKYFFDDINISSKNSKILNQQKLTHSTKLNLTPIQTHNYQSPKKTRSKNYKIPKRPTKTKPPNHTQFKPNHRKNPKHPQQQTPHKSYPITAKRPTVKRRPPRKFSTLVSRCKCPQRRRTVNGPCFVMYGRTCSCTCTCTCTCICAIGEGDGGRSQQAAVGPQRRPQRFAKLRRVRNGLRCELCTVSFGVLGDLFCN